MKSQDLKNWSIAVFYALMVVCVVTFTISYAFVDWEDVMDDFQEGTKDLAETVQCEMDYKGFHFEGFCTDKEIVLEYMQNMTQGCEP